MPNATVAVIAFDRISPFHLSVPCAVFGEDRRDLGVPHFEFLVCAAEKGPLSTTAGFSLAAPHVLTDLERAEIVIVPSWRDPDEEPPPALLQALREAHERGSRIVGLCLGTYVLAAAGLLEGRPATTHWAFAGHLARRYPHLEVKPDVLYVDDGDIVTSAGVAAGIDCCLHILRTLCGAEVASRVARRMVVPPHRQGGQAQYIEQPVGTSPAADRFSRLLEWVQQHLDKPHTLDALSAKAFMSRRTFTRRFRQVTGTTFGKWLITQRLALAQRLLETTDNPIDLIAQQAGFGNSVSLRQHFNAAFRTSPVHYRKEFRGDASA